MRQHWANKLRPGFQFTRDKRVVARVAARPINSQGRRGGSTGTGSTFETAPELAGGAPISAGIRRRRGSAAGAWLNPVLNTFQFVENYVRTSASDVLY